ncbi:hypothetical protein I4U23_021741 [Adineta vaga]|nr:hypothetical protein I4U23_021741 [Adineta vaga]
MSKFYGKLKEILLISENEILIPITKQNSNENIYLIEGKNENIPLWHYILVSYENIPQIKAKGKNDMIDCTLFSRPIEYFNQENQICSLSGWGKSPSRDFQNWIEKYYKSKQILIHSNLSTVQHNKPIFLRSSCKKSQLEDLSNELFFDIFDYLTLDDLYNGFYNLNNRFNKLIKYSNNKILIINEKLNFLLIELYKFQTKHLILNTLYEFDLKQFSNIHSLIIRNRNYIEQIHSSNFPYLINLTLILKSNYKPPIKLINEIFSNQFLSLRYLILGRIEKSSLNSWSICSSLQYLSIRSHNLMILPDILSICPNLIHIQLHILNNSHYFPLSLSTSSHLLQRFTLWSNLQPLSIDIIDSLLSYIPNIQRLYLQTICPMPFVVLAEHLIKRLNYLLYFSVNNNVQSGQTLWRKCATSYGVKSLVIGIDPSSTYTYVVQSTDTFILDINLNVTIYYSNTALWDPGEYIFAQATVVTEDHHLYLLAYRAVESEESTPYLFTVILTNLSIPIQLPMIKLPTNQTNQDFFHQKQYTMLSMSLHEESKMIIVGIPFLDMVFILSFRENSESPIIIHKHISFKKGIFFGKSVAILDNNTYAVLLPSTPTLPWSSSQVQIYSINNLTISSKPIFVFPNNQQPIEQMYLLPLPYRIVNFVSWSSNSLGLVLDPHTALLVPVSPPGYCSSMIEKYTNTEISFYRIKPCISGTYQKKLSFGPCKICPAQWKNNGSSGLMCDKCSLKNKSLCFLGAINEIDIISIGSYDQTNSYPESPQSTQFDDLLLHNIFKFPDLTIECIFLSPIFWSCLTILVFLIIFILSKLIFSYFKSQHHRSIILKFFYHIDLISEGEYWFGGLISLSIFVLIIFVCKFSISFASLYPIEETSLNERTSVLCDGTLFNAKFTSSLQLLSTSTYQEKPILNLLNNQIITLTVQFISTAFSCSDLSMQQNTGHGLNIPSKNFICDSNHSILYISTILPQHIVTMEFDLIGPHHVGGLRLCFSAPSIRMDNGIYIVQNMDYCKLFYTENETLTFNPTINVKMTKAVNRTASMIFLNDVMYTGLWLPTLTTNTLTDNLLFSQKGDFYRYLHTKMTLIVDITESEFYMKNTQEPIARTYEITFNTILFSMLCLDLFGLLFIIFKLAILPLIKLLSKYFFNKTTNKSLNSNKLKEININHRTHNVAVQTLTEITEDDDENRNEALIYHENWISKSKF